MNGKTIELDNELLERLIRGTTVPYPVAPGESVDIRLTDEGLSFIRGRIKSGDVPELHPYREP